MIYISNAISLQMQGNNELVSVASSVEQARAELSPDISGDRERQESRHGTGYWVYPASSCIGHADVAAVINGQLGLSELGPDSNGVVPRYEMVRSSISLNPGDVLWVAQYCGPRLPEGATTLPEGATIRWYKVTCYPAGRSAKADNIASTMYSAAAEQAEFGGDALEKGARAAWPHLYDENAYD